MADSVYLRSLVLHPSPDVVAERAGESVLLIHLETNHIYELNQTGARLWEVIGSGRPPEAMLEEFDVTREQLCLEVEALVSMLLREGLVIDKSSDQ